MSISIIYGLIDPRTLLIRYIGKSTSGLTRPKGHRCPSNLKDTTHRSNWIRSLHAKGLCYVITILETCSSADALAAAECWWIAFGRSCDWPLTNITDGGEGSRGRVVSAEQIDSQRKALARYYASPGVRENIGEQSKQRWSDPEYRALMLAKNRSHEPGLKLLISGDSHWSSRDPDSHAKMSAAAKTWMHTPEGVATLKRRPRRTASEATREKMRRSQRLRWKLQKDIG